MNGVRSNFVQVLGYVVPGSETTTCPDAPAPLPARLARKIDPIAAVTVESSQQLLDHHAPDLDRDRVGVFFATRTGGWTSSEADMRLLHESRDATRVGAYLATKWFPAAPQGEATIRLGLGGYSKTFAGNGDAFVRALDHAVDLLEDGVLEAAVVGAAEVIRTPFITSSTGHGPLESAAYVLLGSTGAIATGVILNLNRRDGVGACPGLSVGLATLRYPAMAARMLVERLHAGLTRGATLRAADSSGRAKKHIQYLAKSFARPRGKP